MEDTDVSLDAPSPVAGETSNVCRLRNFHPRRNAAVLPGIGGVVEDSFNVVPQAAIGGHARRARSSETGSAQWSSHKNVASGAVARPRRYACRRRA